ncbi:DUF499 domain-containing protein [Desulfovibrio sulfodismutans]|uniref:DUF499 domain-containing protein n=1 Tax=Desulfolutivibrio sulfodismutans TaxID=63561 RepID=A0A7K3NQ92_9BACT|nr:DUF499 domain-containing protein [Desulfolutivibrio sulfodismutans]NDY57379.1 DUF499 domain-containing protein [Desulfolutivibrio sulfodismutans]QLA12921.1 DUF499 domain-containing protein [Desulfolutivibrio sulfodismutans DSM 3696]
MTSLFNICQPREDVLKGSVTESDFAADLAMVLRDQAPPDYQDPRLFFANTHPTRGLKNLLWNVSMRLCEQTEGVASIFRLDTNYGGGKTHALIALAHLARGVHSVPNIAEFIDPQHLPKDEVRIAAFDGENADPANGRSMGGGIRAHTPWGELAYALGGYEGFEKLRQSDTAGQAPGAETIRELFGGAPTLILLDELSVYLRKVWAGRQREVGEQLTPFLTALFKAVESSPNAAVVYTLAIGKDGASDAYSPENDYIARKMSELESVSARKATLLNPTEDDETVQVLRRRLFASIDDEQGRNVVESYHRVWTQNRDKLPGAGFLDKKVEAFLYGYPFHPDLIETLKEKTSTLENFQRVRGMLRLLARTVCSLWRTKPSEALAVHVHHVDPSYEPIRQELVTRLSLQAFVPALNADVAAKEGAQPALAQEIDKKHYAGLPPYASYVARTIILHTFAFNENLKGAEPGEVKAAIVAPGLDIGFIEDAIRRFQQDSEFLDDKPHSPLRFLTEANLNQMVRRQEKHVDKGETRAQLNDRIREIFGGMTFHSILFPSMPSEVPDDAGDGHPYLAILSYDATEIRPDQVNLPELVRKLYKERGSSGEFRSNQNNLVFLIVDASKRDEMRQKMMRRLALDALRQPERLQSLAGHQQSQLQEWFQRSEQELAVSIQQAYRHVFYPSKNRVEGADIDLAYTVIDVQNAGANPGDGQRQVSRVLHDMKKLRLAEDQPDSASYMRDRTSLRSGRISTAKFRDEFRRNPTLPMLVGDDVFIRGIRQGVELGEYVYQSGELVWGKGGPPPQLRIDEQSFVFTTAYARENLIWPKPEPKPTPPPIQPTEQEPPTGETGTDGGGDTPDKGTAQPEVPVFPKHFETEGVLKEALTLLWEKARSANVQALESLRIRVYDASEGFKLFGPVNAVQKARKKVSIQGEYETTDGSSLVVEFNGLIADAAPVKEFLDPQLRAANEKNMTVEFSLTFEDGLGLDGGEPEAFSEKLCKFGAGAAYVLAQVKVKNADA